MLMLIYAPSRVLYWPDWPLGARGDEVALDFFVNNIICGEYDILERFVFGNGRKQAAGDKDDVEIEWKISV